MLVSLCLLLYAFITAYVNGLVCKTLIERYGNSKVNLHPALTTLLGCSFIGIMLQMMHLFIPINTIAHCIIWGMTSAGWIVLRVHWHFPINRNDISGLLIFSLAALLNIVGRTGTGDIADYHLQAIQWIEQFAVVPGIGNLRRQLANNSNWFALHAFFGWASMGLKSVYTMNGLLLILGGWYFTPQKTDRLFLVKLTIWVYLATMAYRKYVGSVTNDYAITVCTLILCYEFLSQSRKSLAWLMCMSLLFLVMPTFKLSAIALLFPVCYWVYQLLFNQRFTLFIIVISLLIYTPWLVTNHIQSGYMVYPIIASRVMPADWTMPVERLQYERDINLANERMPGVPISEALQTPVSKWLVYWVTHLDAFSLILLIGFIISLIGLFWRYSKHSLHTKILVFTTLTATIIWITQAPAIRFMFPYLVVMIGLFLHTYFPIKFRRAYVFCVPFILIAGGIGYGYAHLVDKSKSHLLILPLPYQSEELSSYQLSDGNRIYTSDGNKQCWDHPIPCSTEIPENLRLRGAELKDGFKIVNEY